MHNILEKTDLCLYQQTCYLEHEKLLCSIHEVDFPLRFATSSKNKKNVMWKFVVIEEVNNI